MREVLLAAMILFSGCDSGPVGRFLGGGPDTLAGYRLGMMLPDVRAQAESLGDVFECDYQLADRWVFCGPPAVDGLGGDRLEFAFRDGELVLLTRDLGESWNDVPFDTIPTLLRAYGELPARTIDTSYSWQRTMRNITVQVTCLGPGARCTITIARRM